MMDLDSSRPTRGFCDSSVQPYNSECNYFEIVKNLILYHTEVDSDAVIAIFGNMVSSGHIIQVVRVYYW